MHRKPVEESVRVFATAALIVLACLMVAACGASKTTSNASVPSTTAATPAATSAAPATTATAPKKTTTSPTTPPPSEAAQLRACLARNGIHLPNTGSSLLKLLRSAERLPKGVSRSHYESVVRSCTAAPPAGKTVKPSPITNPRVTASLTRFAACMRQNKINLPNPNTSGSGPVFNTKGINTSAPQFRAALVKCSVELRELLKARPGASSASPLR